MLTLSFSVFASNDQSNLTAINHKIDSIRSNINEAQTNLHQVQRRLESLEIKTATVAKGLEKTNKDIIDQQSTIEKLKADQQQDQRALQAIQAQLANQLRANYQLWRQPYFKLMLSPETKKLDRMLIYYRYLNTATGAAINRIQTLLNQIQANLSLTQQHMQELYKLKNKQQQSQQNLQQLSQDRKLTVTQISQTIQTKKQKLNTLLANRQRLEQTLVELEKQPKVYGQGFVEGRLPLPTKGKITTTFGTQIDQSELRWTGVLIKAPLNQPVFAIASGTVVFAKWLEGYGLLIIIDHGKGYMSLYGRNHYLYKAVGQTVKAGDIIAAVGNSGGYADPALYFALRLNAKPLNPLKWCSRT